ncbi:MAG: hypothetical protein C5B54_11935 [Acidobacteria bacterium]|nr:MAG: hypothetical protein C5B54_11935 [Acidobacteriota bacterium]
MKLKTWHFIFLLALITLGFRIFQLSADPPSNFSWSGGEFADEGYWSHNARNSVLFGNALQDEWDARVVSPIFAAWQWFSFYLFGVGLVQVRIIGIVSSILISITIFFLMKKQFDDQISFFCAALVSLCYPMLVLGRQGLLDPFAAALACLAILFATSESPLVLFLSGVFLVAACITKYLMIFVVVPIFISLQPGAGKKWLPFLIGAVLSISTWLFADYVPNHHLIASYGSYYSSQQSWQLTAVVKNIVLQPFYLYFIKTPAILFFGNLMLWYFLADRDRANTAEKVLWYWLICGIIVFALWRYRPIRYYTSLIPPLGCLAGLALIRTRELSEAIRRRPVVWIGLAIPALQILFVLADRALQWNLVPVQLGIQTLDAVLFLLLTISAFFLFRKPVSVFFAFFLVFLAGDMWNFVNWQIHPEYQAVTISSDLQKRIGNGVVAGQWAPELCLENRVRAVPVWYGFVNSKSPFQRYGISHLLVWRYALGGEKFEEWYPEDFKNFEPVTRYTIKDSELILYERRKR